MSYAEKALLLAQLGTIQMFPGEDPELFLARAYKLIHTMQVVGTEKSDGENVQILVGQLSDDYDVEKRSFLSSSDITRALVEHTIRILYTNGKVKKSKKSQVPSVAAAAPRNPHSLIVVGFRQSRGGRCSGQRRGGGGYPGVGVGQQQLWARGGGGQQQEQQQLDRGGMASSSSSSSSKAVESPTSAPLSCAEATKSAAFVTPPAAESHSSTARLSPTVTISTPA